MDLINKKTCFILNYAPHYRANVFKYLARELKCDLFCGSKLLINIKKIEYENIDFKINELKTKWFFGKFAWMKNQLNLLLTNKYKNYVLTGQPFFLSDTVFILLCFFSNKKVYLWNHSPKNLTNRVRFFYNKIIFSMIDGFFLYSDMDKDIMIKDYRINEEKLHVIYNSLEYDEHLKLREEALDVNYYKENKFFKNPHLPILIFIGRLEPVKKIEWLLDALSTLNTKNLFLNLMIVGDGSQREFLENKALEMSGQVYFYGKSYCEETNGKLLANADLCVSPGNVGLTAIHSLSFGTPVCSHNNYDKQMPEVEAIKEGETGTFFSYELDDLENTIENWFKHKTGRHLTREKCYKMIDDFYNPIYQASVFKKVLNSN